nr:SURF1 family protein [Antrihabitans stalactiti]
MFRPGWVILALLVAVFAYLCFSVLAPWQLGKNSTTEHRNQLIEDSLKSDPVPAEELLGPGKPETGDEWRLVTVTGHYLANSDVLVRLRSHDGTPAYEVLTPFALNDGRAVLVDRGFLDAVEGTKPPAVAAAPTQQVTLDGRIRKSEGSDPDKKPIFEDGFRQVYSIDPQQVSQVLNTALLGGYIQLTDDQAGGFAPVPLPQLDAGPYLSYGLQWLAFGVMAPLGLAYFVRAELLERRKNRGASPEPAPAPVTKEDKLADRYGRRG